MRQRLQGGRFRWLNETLYTTDGQAALRMMRQEPQLMEQYHEGTPPGCIVRPPWLHCTVLRSQHAWQQ